MKINIKKVLGLLGAAAAAAGSVFLAEKAGENTFQAAPQPLGEEPTTDDFENDEDFYTDAETEVTEDK